MTAPPSTEDHVAEHIPWEQLTITPPPDRRRLWYGVAGVMGAVVIAMVVVPNISTAPAAVPVVPSPAPVSTSPVAVPLVAGPDTPDVLSEADLLAIDGLGLDRALAARAEWVVLEFFTLDPADNWVDRVELAARVQLSEDTAPDIPLITTVSYVEWVRATAVEPIRTGQYRVRVAMRRLVALDGATYQRLAVEQVDVDLLVGMDGIPGLTAAPVIVEVAAPPIADTLNAVGRRTDVVGVGWPSGESDGTAEAPS